MNTKKVKTNELVGAALDFAVAKCEGLKPTRVLNQNGIQLKAGKMVCAYSTNWQQGGEIIERERIATLCPRTGDFWDARDGKKMTIPAIYHRGETLLIAAMRCYVASKLGDSVEIPSELTV
jgi:hypothetical protein